MLQAKIIVDEQGLIGVGVKFERIRRITGYLVGTLDRFNNAKRQEEGDRVKHGLSAIAPRPAGEPMPVLEVA